MATCRHPLRGFVRWIATVPRVRGLTRGYMPPPAPRVRAMGCPLFQGFAPRTTNQRIASSPIGSKYPTIVGIICPRIATLCGPGDLMLDPLVGVIRSGHPIRRFRHACLLSVVLLILPLPPLSAYPRSYVSTERDLDAAQDSNATPVLESGKPLKRELSGGETHVYQLALMTGQYARLTVDQQGINAAVAASDQNGKTIIIADTAGIGDAESFSLVAEASASFRVEVRSPDKSAPGGRYVITVTELRAATEQDTHRVNAERAAAEGMLLYSQQRTESRRKALEKYQVSLSLWQSAKDPSEASNALYMIGLIYNGLGEYRKALEAGDQGLLLARDARDRRREAYLLNTIANSYYALGDGVKAFDFYGRALTLSRSEKDRVGEVMTLSNLGMAYGSTGEPHKALDHFNQVLSIVNVLGDRGKEATTLGNLCSIQTSLGEYKKALDSCNRSLSLKRELNDRLGEAATHGNVGVIHFSSGEYQKSLDSHTRSLNIHKDLGNSQGEAIALNNIGLVYATLGEYEKAIGYYDQALQPLRKADDKRRIATALNNIAVSYAKLSDYQKALEKHLQVLSLHHDAGNKEGEAITLNNIANCYQNLGEKPKALDYYSQAVALHRTVANPRLLATALRNIGDLQRQSGEYQKALDYFNEGLQISRDIGDRNNEAGILVLVASIERDRGNLAAARQRIEEALAAFESLRISVKSHQLRASFLATVRKNYGFEIDVLMRLHKQRPSEGFDAAALEASERCRARSLLELLGEAQTEIRQGVDPALIDREVMLRQIISDKAERQMRMLSGQHTQEQASGAAKEIDALTTEYDQVQGRIRETSPRYAALTRPVPLGAKTIQQQVLDDDTLLLEYALGEEKSFLWAVTPASIKSVELPKRSEIEQAARRVYELSTARNKQVPKETIEQRRLRLERADVEYLAASSALGKMILGPIAAELKNKRLLIVSDGILQYVPFAALPNPLAADAHPLILDNEIVSLPSASVLAVIRQETANRKPAGKALAVLADPVFSTSDPRVHSSSSQVAATIEPASAAEDAKRSAAESGVVDLDRLRFSRQEADEIARLAAEKARLKAVDFAANRPLATSGELGDYRIVHLASHALINNEHPELSGVVLSLVDQQGRPQNGFLRLYDIYNLKLAADLVVLSACQTALGKEINGEGIVGITRGFMYAGAPRVVASLWRIDDRATAELMKRFYGAMFGDGLTPAQALRAAQISMWKDKRWQSPYYWAAFTLQGEWK